MQSTTVLYLRCSNCDETVSADILRTFCTKCNSPYLVEYDYRTVRRDIRNGNFFRQERSLWRYRRILPVADDEAIVSLGEGWTPLLHLEKLGQKLGLHDLWIKDEGCNPTGSFKSRGISVAVSRARELGVRRVGMPSAGNAGGALAAYAAKAGMHAEVWVPKDTPVVNIQEVGLYGGTVRLVGGDISDAAAAMRKAHHPPGWFDVSTMKEPYRLEGKKTMGYEIAEQFGWKHPDAILYPTGGGTGLIGIWKAVREMEQIGLVTGRKPKMICVQAAGCAPVVRAFREGKRSGTFWKNARTAASGLRVPKAFADTLILSAIAESRGTAVSVSDREILADMRSVAATEGLFICPEGAATVAALRKLIASGFLGKDEKIVLLNTGTGYKYIELFT